MRAATRIHAIGAVLIRSNSLSGSRRLTPVGPALLFGPALGPQIMRAGKWTLRVCSPCMVSAKTPIASFILFFLLGRCGAHAAFSVRRLPMPTQAQNVDPTKARANPPDVPQDGMAGETLSLAVGPHVVARLQESRDPRL